MPSKPTESLERDQRLQDVVLDYLKAVDAGQKPDQQELLARHGDLAADLKAFFSGQHKIQEGIAPLRGILEPEASKKFSKRAFGNYLLIVEIGHGGMGVVYKAQQIRPKRIVALKMIRAGQLASPDDVRRFRAESENAATLDHPNIVPIYEVGECDGQHYFTMKRIEGGGLNKHLRLFTQSPRASARLVAKVARAVHHAHQRGILHRDLKPANILLDVRGRPHVTDFGLAKRVEGDAGMTQTGIIVGTPSHMAPEQAAGQKQLTTAVDVHGLGTILYELLTGQPPFGAATLVESLRKVLEQEPVRPRTLNPRLDRDLDTICLKCLEKDPNKRYGSAEALAEDLEYWLAGEPIEGRRTGVAERALKWAKRRPAIATLLGACVLQALGMIALVAELRVNAQKLAAVPKGLEAANKELERQISEQDDHLKNLTEEVAKLKRDNEFSARGRTALEKGLYDLAIAELTEALQEDLHSPELYQLRGMAYSGKGLYEQAFADFTSGLELAPKSGWLYARRAENSLHLLKFENALADCAEALKLPGDHRHHTVFTRGCVYETQGEYEKALQDLSEAIEIKPEMAHPHFHRGAVNANLQRWDKSAADYGEALQLLPTNPENWFIHACLLLQIEDTEGFKKLCRRMAERFGKNDNEIELLAHAMVLGPEAVSDRDRIQQLVEQRMAKASSLPRRIWLAHVPGLAYYRAGHYDKAIECQTKGLNEHKDWEENVLNWLVLAMAHQRLKHGGEALLWLDKARQWKEKKTASVPKQANRFAHPGWLWQDWLELKILFREAETLIREDTSTAKPGNPREAPEAKGDKEKGQGEWILVSREADGRSEKVTIDSEYYQKLKFEGDNWHITFRNGEEYSGTFTIDSSKKPKIVDATFKGGDQDGQVWKGFYELDGDTLKICTGYPGSERPAEFKSKDDMKVFTYERAKAENWQKVITTKSGLKYRDMREGTGKEAQAGDQVVVHYTGWLEDGIKFDSSKDRNKPFSFPLGAGKVIKGWDEGVAGMKLGGKRKLVIPPELGYGKRGYPPAIAPDAELTFEIEFIEIKGQARAPVIPANEDKGDNEKAQGEWKLVSLERNGESEKVAEYGLDLHKLRIEGNNFYQFSRIDGFKATFAVDSSKKPKTIDITLNVYGTIIKGLYELNGDTLKICRGTPDSNDRPAEIKSQGMVWVYIYVRVTDKDSFQGEWSLVSYEQNGIREKVTNSGMVYQKVKITGGNDGPFHARLIGPVDGLVPPGHLHEGNFSIDFSKKPKTIDLIGNGNAPIRQGIYKMDGDSLKICFGPTDAPRPAEFKSTDKVMVITYKRVKAEDKGDKAKFQGERSSEVRPAAENGQKVITTKSGLKYVDLREGTGREARFGDQVVVHYTGWLKDGTKFDSSKDRNIPIVFSIGKGVVIKGWDEGIAGMKVGGKRKLIIPPELAYGSRGAGRVIPANAELTFEIELIEIEGQARAPVIPANEDKVDKEKAQGEWQAAQKMSEDLVAAPAAQQDELLGKYKEAKGAAYTLALAGAIPRLSAESKTKARNALAERFTRMTAVTLRAELKDDEPEIRSAASLACAMKDDKSHIPDLIPLLDDPEPLVARAAHAALRSLANQDFGPAKDASPGHRAQAIAAWKGWWTKQEKK